MLRTFSGDLGRRLFKGAFQILRAGLKATDAIILLTERGAEGQRVAAVPRVIDERVNDAAHASRAAIACRQLTLLRSCADLSGADKIR